MIPLVMVLIAAQAAAPADCRSCDLLAKLSSALSEASAGRFFDHVDRAMPDYANFRTSVEALLAQNDIGCSIDVLEEKGDKERIDALVDWFMDIRSTQTSGPMERRRMRVHVLQEKQKGEWKVTDIQPRSILGPLEVR